MCSWEKQVKEWDKVSSLGNDLFQENGNTYTWEKSSDCKEGFHDEAIHWQVSLHQLNHIGAKLSDKHCWKEREDKVGNPRINPVNSVKLFKFAFFNGFPTNVLPYQVCSGCSIEENCTDSTNCCSDWCSCCSDSRFRRDSFRMNK